MTNSTLKTGVLVLVLAAAGIYLFPWKNIEWGKVSMVPAQTVTVTGEAKSLQKSQIATFTAGVNVINDKRDVAAGEVNSKISALTEAVKKFGIPEADIKTQSISYYQQQEQYYDNGVQKFRQGQWNVSNTVEITLRDLTKANELTNLLSSSGANNVYGPNFALDDTKQAEVGLVDEAIKNARVKAEAMAKASGRSLGKVLVVNEGGSQNSGPIYYAAMDKGGMGGGGGSDLQPGTGTVYKNVTVTFELK